MGVAMASIPIRLARWRKSRPYTASRSRSTWRGFDHLAPHPGRGRVRGHMDVHEFAPTMGNEDQHVQGFECEGGHREQVSGPQVMGVVAQERPPGLAGGASRSAPAVASNRTVADDNAQLEQLASDALGAPQAVFTRHGPDQLLDLRTEMRPTASGARPPTP